MKCLLCRLTIVSIFCARFLFGGIHSGKADAGPDPWAPGNSIGTPISTQVRMVEEYVQMDLSDSREVDPLQLQFFQSGFVIKVQADFRMKNMGDSTEELKVYFPLGIKIEDMYYDLAISDFQVWVDDKPVGFQKEQYHVDKQKDPFDNTYTSATFLVRFPVGQDTLIHVTYTIGSRFVPGVGGMESIAYIFETGAGWKGTIGKAVLVVNLLDDSSQESVMKKPAGGKMDGRSITWTWTNFEPVEKDNFSMVLVNPRAWEEVTAARQQVEQNPKDGAALTRLAALYFNLASGRLNIAYPYFARLTKSALQKSMQLSPYDPEPHYWLFMLHYNEIGKLPRDGLTQVECEIMVNEINQFLIRTTETSDYQELDNLLEEYDDMSCPSKPTLTTQRGIFPTLTATPIISPTALPTEYPFAEETLAAFRKTHSPGIDAVLEPSKTLPPTKTVTVTRTPIKTVITTPTPQFTETQLYKPEQVPSSTPTEATKSSDLWLGWLIAVIGVTGSAIIILWQASHKRHLS